MTTILITGANKGIGLALTRQFAAQGDRVLACCRDPGKATDLQAVASKHANVTAHAVQISDGASVAALAAAVGSTPIDVLINNAGTAVPAKQSLAEMDYDGWLEAFSINTLAPFRVLQTFRNNLKAGSNARVVTITSQFGAMSFDVPFVYAYSATKAAVNKVMRMASLELIKEGITTVIIHPGHVKTDMGGPTGALTPEESASGIIKVISGLTAEQNGSFLTWEGKTHAW